MHPNQVAAARARFRALGRQVRPVRRVRALRARAHRPAPLPGAGARQRSDQGAAGADPRARGPGADAGSRCVTSCVPSSSASGPARSVMFKDLDSPICLAFLERYPSPTDAALGEQRLGAFLARQHYSGAQAARAAARASSAAPPTGAPASQRSSPPRGRAGARHGDRPARGKISELDREIVTACATHPDGQIFLSLFKHGRQRDHRRRAARRDRRLPRSLPHRDALAADAGMSRRRDRIRQTQSRCFRCGCDKRLRDAFCTLADTTRHWHPWAADHYASREPAATTTPARSAPSDAPGAASYGAAGKTDALTTPPDIAACNSTSRSQSPARRAPGPTSLPPSGCSAPPSPTGGPQGRARSA